MATAEGMIMRSVEIGVLVCFLGQLGLALVALVRAERKDVPEVIRELARWYRWDSHHQG
jgi:hypothetical protein